MNETTITKQQVRVMNKVVSDGDFISTYSWKNESIYNNSLHSIGTTENGSEYELNRMYMCLHMPTLSQNPRIKKAELKVSQYSNTFSSNYNPLFGIVRGPEDLAASWARNYGGLLIDFDRAKTDTEGEVVTYTFDITELVDELYENDEESVNLILKIVEEEEKGDECITLYGSGNGELSPTLTITYESSYGVNTSYRTNTHEIGRFGQGSIDLQCGNLMFESEDFAWTGNRMPVTIKHLYNSALSDYQYTANSEIKLCTADFSAMKLGNGWKLNLMQSMMPAEFQQEEVSYNGYVYIGENGEETYFKESTETVTGTDSTVYSLYEAVDDSEMKYDPGTRTLTQGDDTYLFDVQGRLISITDQYSLSIMITYTEDRITKITDGVCREFSFAYDSDGFLVSITAPDETSISYAYTDGLLTGIAYPEGKNVVLSYVSNKPVSVLLQDENKQEVYKVTYSFRRERVCEVTEYGVEAGAFVTGVSSKYSYSAAARKTVVQTTELMDAAEGETENNIIKNVYTFDEEGNILGEYVYSEDTENVGSESQGSGINPHTNDSGVAANINNLLLNHHFANMNDWKYINFNTKNFEAYVHTAETKYGNKVLYMEGNDEAEDGSDFKNGVYQETIELPEGQYMFSAYIRLLTDLSGADQPGAYLQVLNAAGEILSTSERVDKSSSEYNRLMVPFTLSAAQKVKVCVVVEGIGIVHANAPQLENNPFVSPYNMLINGNFENEKTGWNMSSESSISVSGFNMAHSLAISASIEGTNNVYQDVSVKTDRSTRETFTLSGWAKGYGIVKRERNDIPESQFRLRAVIHYYDTLYEEYGSETFTADFSPATKDWQFASVQFEKSKYRMVDHIRVYCDYDYNWSIANFDCIQLVRNSIEIGLTEEDFVVENEDTSDESSTEESTDVFEEALDHCGNPHTETVFDEEENIALYRSFVYSISGDNLIKETDERGYHTWYDVDDVTSRNKETTDRCGNKTAYEYDDAGRTTKVISKDASANELANVSYAYDSFDNMTEIVRGDGMKYALAYNAFHNLESIRVDGKSEPLVLYTYKDGNGRLKQITYANGDIMKVTYNSIGQMNSEKWYNAESVLTAHYKYVYDGQGNIVRSIDLLGKKEYNYVYEDGNVVRAAEYNIAVNADEIVTAKRLIHSIIYAYDTDGRLSIKRIVPETGTEQVIKYTYAENGDLTVQTQIADHTFTSSSSTDGLGRKRQEELNLGSSSINYSFSYHPGQVTEKHQMYGKVKGTATTQLVQQIVMGGYNMFTYWYDEEGRIAGYSDLIMGGREYTYDALGQLIKETGNGATNDMTYDNYGNILSKNGITYTYGDSVWKDKLTAYGDQTITYDAQGNPVSYLGHALTWEKGRQLKSFDNILYTYNANGIRTSKTVDGVKHTYVLEGTKILSETWGENTLIPLYDNEDSVCGIFYNNVPYYFYKNLQGDVIAITDQNGGVMAQYTYDAWGVCSIYSDNSGCNLANVNPFRYRGYYYDAEIGFYYVSSRYYDPEVGRFINADEVGYLGFNGTIASYNMYAYCENNPVNMIDTDGHATIHFAFAAIGGVVGWKLGDYVAKKIGYRSKTEYWMIRAGVVVGGAVIGWFSAKLLTNILAGYLQTNPAVILKLGHKYGLAKFNGIMKFLGINPFKIASDGSKFAAIAKLYNSKTVTLSYKWTIDLYRKAKTLGFTLTLHEPHGGYGWHIHLNGNNGKLKNLHIQIVKSAWNYLKKIIN